MDFYQWGINCEPNDPFDILRSIPLITRQFIPDLCMKLCFLVDGEIQVVAEIRLSMSVNSFEYTFVTDQ